MNSIVRRLVLCLAFILTSWAQAQTPAPSSVVHSDQHVRDADVVDHYIPIITMEQSYSGSTRLQGYRIQIFHDGRGIYHGLKNVKTLGEVRFQLTRHQVQQLIAEFKKYNFLEVPSEQYGLPKGFGVLTLEFTLRENDKSKTVRFGGQRHAGMLQHAIESKVNSNQWRCPYEDEEGQDPCARLDRYIERVVPIFLQVDLPKLVQEHK